MLAIAVSALSYPIYYLRIMTPVDNDFGSHILFAQYLLQHEPMPVYTVVHPFFQFLIGGIYWLSRSQIGLWMASVIVMVAAQAAAAMILYPWFVRRAQVRLSPAILMSIVVIFAAPVMALASQDGLFYYGYIGLANYHNPTVVLLRPLALLSFILALRIIEESTTSWKLIFFSAVLMVVSALVKPNYVLSILPAVCLLAGWRWLRKEPVDFRFLMFGYVIPGVAVLLVQGLFSFFSPEAGQGSIILAPFQVESGFSTHLGLKFLFSILFPLTVLGVYFPRIKQDPTLLLAWIGFFIGAFQMYFLAENNDRFYDGNFRWGAQIMLFILFAASARLVVRQKGAWRQQLPVWTAALLQLAAGAAYYFHLFQSVTYI